MECSAATAALLVADQFRSLSAKRMPAVGEPHSRRFGHNGGRTRHSWYGVVESATNGLTVISLTWFVDGDFALDKSPTSAGILVGVSTTWTVLLVNCGRI